MPSSSFIIQKETSATLTDFLRKKSYSAHFILVDDVTANHCLPLLLKQQPILHEAEVIEIFSGEEYKDIETVQRVWEKLSEHNADRNAVLINLGGGVVCDLGGFAAATYKRGIDFIHIPTTLLAQVDAAFGGKQGIDFMHFKNQVGVFQMPSAVVVDVMYLKTLPEEQVQNGFAEVVKHSLLAGDDYWKKISRIENLEQVNWRKIVSDSIDFKMSVVKKDPAEKGLRKILNFGHTIGHAIETFKLSNHEMALHGFCIAAGMIGELFLSEKILGLKQKQFEEAVAFLKNHFPLVTIEEKDFEAILQLMKQDKKNEKGKIRMALLKEIGKPKWDVEVSQEDILSALSFLQS
jgi:3-dehydroquinate synthase